MCHSNCHFKKQATNKTEKKFPWLYILNQLKLHFYFPLHRKRSFTELAVLPLSTLNIHASHHFNQVFPYYPKISFVMNDGNLCKSVVKSVFILYGYCSLGFWNTSLSSGFTLTSLCNFSASFIVNSSYQFPYLEHFQGLVFNLFLFFFFLNVNTCPLLSNLIPEI